MKKIFITLLILLLVFSAVQIIKTTYDYRMSQQEYESLQNEFVETQETEATESNISTKPIETVETAPITVDFHSLLKINEDVVGWITGILKDTSTVCEGKKENRICKSDKAPHFCDAFTNWVYLSFACSSSFSVNNSQCNECTAADEQ